MDRFRRLMTIALLSGAAGGLVLFAAQHWAVVPLIETAEAYEAAAHQTTSGMAHEDDGGWQPADGLERAALTALSTTLGGIGLAAVLLAAMVLGDTRPITAHRGALWGLAGFACFVLAPALGMPPEPPGAAAVADLSARQLWWAGTVAATALGLWLLAGRGRPWPARAVGLLCLVLPHAAGAPAAVEANVAPAGLAYEFAAASVATTGLFWVLTGSLCGFLYSHQEAKRTSAGTEPA